VIGTFVLGLGENIEDTSPNAQFNTDFTKGSASGCNPDDVNGGSTLDITHQSGPTIDAARLTISGNGTDQDWTACNGASEVSSGDTANVQVSTESEIRLVWTAEGGSQTDTLITWEGPDA
jgi:hypothetical protein